MNNSPGKYKWMSEPHRELYDGLCHEFNFKNLTDIGNYLDLKNPYHGAKLIFEAKKQNIYLKKLLELKRDSNRKISELEACLKEITGFRKSIETSLDGLNKSVSTIKIIKKSLNL
jgi:hypothetical protein